MVDPAVYPFHQRLLQNPDDAEALFYLWQWYGDRGEFQQLATLVEQVAARRNDPSSAADLYFRAGELWAKNVGRADKAVGNYRRAFELDPSQQQAIESARVIYEQLGNLKLAAQLVEMQLGQTSEASARLAQLRQLASLRARLSDPSGQAAALEEVIRMVPKDFEAMRELAAAYLARAELSEGGTENNMRAASLLVAIAHGLGGEHQLPFAEAALDAWAGDEEAFAIVRENYLASGRNDEFAVRMVGFVAANPESSFAPELRRELAGMYLAAGQFDDAIAALEPLVASDERAARQLAEVYGQAGRVTERVALLAQLPPAQDPVQRVAELREIASVYGQLGERAGSLQALRGILAIDPADPEALAVVEDELRGRNAYEELRQILYGAARSQKSSPEARKQRLREIALISEQKLGDPMGSIEAWRALLAVDPGELEANAAMERLLTRHERWDDLVRWLERRALAATEPLERRALWERLAELHRTRRNDPASEAEALRALWSVDPDDAVAVRLASALERSGEWSAAAEVLSVRAENASETQAAVCWAELAAFWERLRERDEALRAWQRVATLEPGNASAWDAVERLLELTGRHDLLLETLLAHAEGLAAGERPAKLHFRAAELARVLGDLSTATAQAERALELSPEEENTANLLAELYDAVGHPSLHPFLRSRIERLPDGDARLAALRKLAHVVGRTDPHEAVRLWGELREVSRRAGRGDDAEALEALAGFAEASGDRERLAELLLEASVVADTVEARREHLVRRAELLATELGRVDDAMGTLRDLAERVDPNYPAAWARIAELAMASQKTQLAAEAMERELALLGEEDERRVTVAQSLASLWESMGVLPRAVSALELWYDADPTEYAVVERLIALQEQLGNWGEVVKYLAVLVEAREGEEEGHALLFRLARIAEEQLGNPRKAFDALLPAAKEGVPGALDGLRGIADRNGLQGPLVEALTEMVGSVSSREGKAELWRELALRLEREGEDLLRALECALRAAVVEPGHEEDFALVERIANAAGEHARAYEAYSAALAADLPQERAAEIALRGAAYLEAAGAVDGAIDLVLSAQNRAVTDDRLLEAVERMAPTAGRADELYIALDRRRKAERDDAGKLRWLLRSVESAALRVSDREGSLGYARQVISQALGSRGVEHDRLAQLEASARRVDEQRPDLSLRAGLVELYGAIAEEAGDDDPRRAAALARRAAVLCAEELGLSEQAFELLRRGLAWWPADLSGTALLERVAIELRRSDAVLTVYQQLADEAYEGATARGLFARRAEFLAGALRRFSDAIEAYQHLVEFAPKELEPLQRLQQLLREQKRHQELLLALDRQLEAGLGDRAEVLREVARVWDRDLRNAFEAKDSWKRVLRVVPEDREATEALARLEKKPVRTKEELEDELGPAPAPTVMQEPVQEAAELLEAEPETEEPAPRVTLPDGPPRGGQEVEPIEPEVAEAELLEAEAALGAALASEALPDEGATGAWEMPPPDEGPTRAVMLPPESMDPEAEEAEEVEPERIGEERVEMLSGAVSLDAEVSARIINAPPTEHSGEVLNPDALEEVEEAEAEEPVEALDALDALEELEAADSGQISLRNAPPEELLEAEELAEEEPERLDAVEEVEATEESEDDELSLEALARMAAPPPRRETDFPPSRKN